MLELPNSLTCAGRSRVITWYADQLRTHANWKKYDVAQFGVPTDMGPISEALRAIQLPYRFMWGFDSFRGLPDSALDEPGIKNPLWRPGVFSDAYELSPQFQTMRKPTEAVWEYRPRVADAHPLAVDKVVSHYKRTLNAENARIRLVPGFFNESLSKHTLDQMLPLLYTDLNVDLYSSTFEVLDRLFETRLLRSGSMIAYDDWMHTPFGSGQSLAHMRIAERHAVTFEHASRSLWLGPGAACKIVYFIIRSVGRRADAGITKNANHTVWWY